METTHNTCGDSMQFSPINNYELLRASLQYPEETPPRFPEHVGEPVEESPVPQVAAPQIAAGTTGAQSSHFAPVCLIPSGPLGGVAQGTPGPPWAPMHEPMHGAAQQNIFTIRKWLLLALTVLSPALWPQCA